jgi:hypothetical protein
MAVFPDHALTLDELLNEATRQANAPAPRHAPALARIPGDDLIVGPVDLNVNGSSNGAHAPVLLQDFVPLLRPSADPAVSEDRA